MTQRESAYPPELMPCGEAARYIGVSATTLRTLKIPRRELGSKRLFDVLDLDAFASDLPYEGDSVNEKAKSDCDEAFR